MSDMGVSTPVFAIGRELVQNLLVALRSGQLYEPGNATLRAAADRLARTLTELWQVDGWARIEVGRDTVMVNGARVRSELRHYNVHANLVRFFRSIEIGGFEWAADPAEFDAATFAHRVGRLEGTGQVAAAELSATLEEAGLHTVTVLPPREEALDETTDDPDARSRAERTYRHGVAVTQEFMESLRAGRAMRTYKVKRAVQTIVDQVLDDETMLVGLTNLRDYDEPTFTHSVNVCVFSVSLGQRIGLSRFELYELGMAALLHDVGKSDVPREVLLKSEPLEREEWAELQKHPRYGVVRILEERVGQAVPMREVLVAFEHHLNVDLSGYPQLFAPRKLNFYSRIVSICDSFDAGTTPRVYQTDPVTPPEMLEILMRWKGIRYDPILLKAFISLIGIYPPGTLVLLDSMEMAVVTAAGTEDVSRPRARLVTDLMGNRIQGPVVSLSERDAAG
ncbi:MAG TPA: HD domain-containing phosphohydrolase, partial [Gemmatimonadota bacterium]|nr:HD domain-containing phosphohydrolase [Gemmatimonadota bacterium]